jgi:hypothetical protein
MKSLGGIGIVSNMSMFEVVFEGASLLHNIGGELYPRHTCVPIHVNLFEQVDHIGRELFSF